MRPEQDTSLAPRSDGTALYRWLYLFSGLTFLGVAVFFISLSISFNGESRVIQRQLEVLQAQQILSHELKSLAADFWYSPHRRIELVDQFDSAFIRFEELTVELAVLLQSMHDARLRAQLGTTSIQAVETAFSQVRFAFMKMRAEEAGASIEDVQLACNQLLAECSTLVQETMVAQAQNQDRRSWLMGALVSLLLLLVLIVLWFLWSAMNSRREIMNLNRMLERRVAERTSEFERINTFLFNVQASIGSCLIVTDPHNRILIWNPAAEALWGLKRAYVEGESILAVSSLAMVEQLMSAHQRAKTSLLPVHIREFEFTDASGKRRFGAASLVPLTSPGGDPFGVVTLIDDVSEVVHAREQLKSRAAEIEQTNKMLQRANSDLEQFVYAASHDLRAPLTNLAGLTKKIERCSANVRAELSKDNGSPLAESVQQSLEHDIPKTLSRINTSIGRFGSIIDGLLRYSRLGKEEYDHGPVDVEQEVARVVDLYATTIEQKDVHVLVGELPRAFGHAPAVNTIFSNLLGNALNYLSTDRPGEIIIEGERLADGMCLYYIKDNGIGIHHKDLNKVFNIFERLKPGHCPGQGLGLAIVKKSVEIHGGEIYVESQHGVGSTFAFTLPAARAQAPLATAALE